MLSVSKLYAQDERFSPGFGVEANFLAGKVIKHSVKFTAPIPPLSTALDVNFVWQTYGKREWHQRCNFPQIGLGVTYTDYGNNQVFGNCVGIYPNLQIHIYRNEKLEWTFRFGDGVGYVTRKYQATAPVDTINTAIGTHINDFAIFMMDLRFHIDRHWQLQFGANFTHISNSDYHQPNLGVNMWGTHIGVQYYPVTCKPKCIIRELPKLKHYWVADIREGISYKEARAKGNPILPTYITSVYAGRHWHGRNKLFIGADYAYHNDVYAFLKNYGVDYGHEMSHSWDGAFFAGNEFMIGNLGIVTQVGVYYHQTFLKFEPVYEKIGSNYYIIKKPNGPVKEVFLSAMLLTHGIVAEYSEFGIGAGF
ncbi:MAG: acyloxyacyl hydrolase [Chitinophagales bacterium]